MLRQFYFSICVRVLGFFAFLILLSGCSLFNRFFQGSFDVNNWEIQKIVIDGKEYLGAGELRKQAILALGKSKGELSQSEFDQNPTKPGYTVKKDSNEDSLEEIQELAQSTENSVLTFDVNQNKIYGVAACNQFSANYIWKDADRISIYGASFTRKLCSPHQLMDFEVSLGRKLEGIYFVTKVDKTSMILKSDRAEIYLKQNENFNAKN